MIRRWGLIFLLWVPVAALGAIATPVAPTELTVSGPNPSTHSSGAFTPTGDALVVACLLVRDPAGGVVFDGFTGHDSSTSWTTVSGTGTEYGSDNVQAYMGWTIAPSSPTSDTVDVSFSSVNPDRIALAIFEIDDGFDSTTPVAQSDNSGTASTVSSHTDNFSAAPDAGSVLLSCIFGSDEFPRSQTPDTGWTELEENTASLLNGGTQYRTGTTSTQYGVTWSDTVSNGVAASALEIQEPAAGGTAIPTTLRRRRD